MAVVWKGSLGGIVLAVTMAALPFARSSATGASTPIAGPSVPIARATVACPVLSRMPRRLVLDDGAPAIVTVNGEHFEAELTLSFDSTFFDATFDALALTSLSPTRLSFDARTMPAGTYTVTAHNAGGQVSNALTLTIVRR